MKYLKNKYAYLVLIVVAFVLLNIFSSSIFGRYKADFTEERVFTLSESTKKILEQNDEPIKFKLFFSNKLANGIPVLKSFYARIRGLLGEYADKSGGKIEVEAVNIEPFTEEEDLAVSYGLKGVEIDQLGNKLYFGIVATNSVDDAKMIPFVHFDREKYIEYDLSRIVYELSSDKKPKIGLITSLPIEANPAFGVPGLGGGSWIFLQQIKKLFTVESVDLKEGSIADDVELLLVVQPEEISDSLLYEIDQFVLSGKRAIFFLDPMAELSSSNKDKNYKGSFVSMLKTWGVGIDRDHVVLDRLNARAHSSDYLAKGHVSYLAWLALGGDNISKDDIVTDSLRVVNLSSAGYIEKLSEEVEFEPLIWSSERSSLINKIKLGNSADPNRVMKNFTSQGKSFTMAARVRGELNSAYPDKKNNKGHLSKSAEKANFLVVADSDMLADSSWVRTQSLQGYNIVVPYADNGAFVVNAVDHMIGSGDLIDLRGRTSAARPFVRLEELKRKAEERYLNKEKQLQADLQQTEARLAQLQKNAESSSGNQVTIQAQQRAEIQRFSDRAVQVRKQLRKVQRELNKDIESLAGWLKFINIFLMPMLVVILAITILLYRNKQKTGGSK